MPLYHSIRTLLHAVTAFPPVQGKIKSLESIYLFSMPVKEYQIVEYFLGSALKDEVMKIMPVQKQTRAGQRTRFKVRHSVLQWQCSSFSAAARQQVVLCGVWQQGILVGHTAFVAAAALAATAGSSAFVRRPGLSRRGCAAGTSASRGHTEQAAQP